MSRRKPDPLPIAVRCRIASSQIQPRVSSVPIPRAFCPCRRTGASSSRPRTPGPTAGRRRPIRPTPENAQPRNTCSDDAEQRRRPQPRRDDDAERHSQQRQSETDSRDQEQLSQWAGRSNRAPGRRSVASRRRQACSSRPRHMLRERAPCRPRSQRRRCEREAPSVTAM